MRNSSNIVLPNSTPLISNQIFLRSVFTFFIVCIFAFAPLFFRFNSFGDTIFIFDALTIVVGVVVLALMSSYRRWLILGAALGIGSVIFLFSIPYFLGGGEGVLMFGILLLPFSIIILLAQFIFQILCRYKGIQFIQKLTIFIMVFSILFSIVSVTDYLRERAIRSTYLKNDYKTYTAQDLVDGQSTCKSLISPFNRQGCVGYFYWRMGVLEANRGYIEREAFVKRIRTALEKDLAVIPLSREISLDNGNTSYNRELNFDYKKVGDVLVQRKINFFIKSYADAGYDTKNYCPIDLYYRLTETATFQYDDTQYGKQEYPVEVDSSASALIYSFKYEPSFTDEPEVHVNMKIKPDLHLEFQLPKNSGCENGLIGITQK